MSACEHLEPLTFRAASLAGFFYPNEDFLIRSALQAFGLTPNPKVSARCILAPHGSWYVMGNSLASAYKSLIKNDEGQSSAEKRDISKVVLLGICHHSDEDGIFLSESDYFETPIGNLIIDKDINEALLSCNTLFELNDIPHLREDITETHFPFIKFLFPKASFIPVLVGGFSLKTMNSLASALHIIFEPILNETLFIISSNSAINADPKAAQIQFDRFTALVKKKNSAELLRNVHDEKISACGTLIMAAMLESGLLDTCTFTEIPHSEGSVLEADEKTVHYAAFNFS